MATASTLCGALLAENGQTFRLSSTFVSQQWLWSTSPSWRARSPAARWSSPAALSALQVAAAIAAIAPIAVVLASLFLLDERKVGASAQDAAHLSKPRGGIEVGEALPRRPVPVPLFLRARLRHAALLLHDRRAQFSQSYIGILGAIASAGWIAGALVHRLLLRGMSSKALLYLSIVLGTLSAASFLLLADPVTAAIVNFANGVAMMIATIASLTLAADYCPKRAEGFAFAGLMSIMNLAELCSNTVGAYLYDHVFDARLGPLIIVSAASTALALVLVPLLRLDGSVSR